MNQTVRFAPPPGALEGWPGCEYPKPLQDPGYLEIIQQHIWTICPVFHVVFGTFGNFVTALVIFRNCQKMTSTSVLLLALAVSDTVFLYTSPLRNWILTNWGTDIRGFSDVGCKLAIFVVYSSYQVSSWYLVVLTIERLLCISIPHKVKLYFNPKKATVIVVIITTIICTQNSHLLYGYGNSPLERFQGREHCYVAKENYATFHNYYMQWIHFIIGFMTPCLIIVVGNSVIIYKLRTSMTFNRRSSHKRQSVDQVTSRMAKRRKSVTVMLVVLNVIFFVSQTPLTIFLVCESFLKRDVNHYACVDFQEYLSRKARFQFTEAVVHNLGYLNASVNFLLYVVSGTKFRQDVMALLLCRARAHRPFSGTRDDSSKYGSESRRHTSLV